jgi:hypothetical protein
MDCVATAYDLDQFGLSGRHGSLAKAKRALIGGCDANASHSRDFNLSEVWQ